MKLDPEFSSDVGALIERLEENVTTALDPGDPDDRRLIESFLDLSNKRSDRYPALHAALSSGYGMPDGPADELRIVDAGRTRDGRATACAWHAAAGGAFLSGVATLALDSESRAPLAFGTGTQVGGSRATAATDVTAAAAAGKEVTALSFFHSQYTPDDPPRFGVALASRKALGSTDFTIDVTDPTQAPRNPGNVVIAVSRMEATPPNYCNDTDYCYAQESAEPTYQYNLVPFTGTATNLPSPIVGVDPTTHNISDLMVASALYVDGSPQSMLGSVDSPSTLALSVTADANDDTSLSWSYPFDALPQSMTKSLRYASTLSAWSNTFAFLFDFSIPVADSSLSPFRFTVCSTSWQHAPSETCKSVPNMTIWWHCVAAGTAVTLEDGSTRPIEDIDNRVRVATAAGGSLAVEATSRALHSDDDGPLSSVIRVTTERGRELVLTAFHPVITEYGPVAATDLEPGAAVLTADGVDTVSSCEQISQGGLFCNLKLADDDTNPPFGAFLANGIAVGDQVSQATHYEATRRDLEYMLARLPDSHHIDYESALADLPPT